MTTPAFRVGQLVRVPGRQAGRVIRSRLSRSGKTWMYDVELPRVELPPPCSWMEPSELPPDRITLPEWDVAIAHEEGQQ